MKEAKTGQGLSLIGNTKDAGTMNAESSVLNLLPKVYDELRRIAATQMARGPSGSTLQPTALVHEAWMRLGGVDQPDWQNRAHFFAAATEAMRNVLIDRARARRTGKRGGDQVRVSVEEIHRTGRLKPANAFRRPFYTAFATDRAEPSAASSCTIRR